MTLPRASSSASHRQAGLTIVEAIVALGVLTFGLLVVFEQFDLARRQALDHEARVQARWLAHMELQRLLACPAETLAGELPERVIAEHPRFTTRATAERRPDGLIEVRVRVGWDQPPQAGQFAPGRSVEARGVRAP